MMLRVFFRLTLVDFRSDDLLYFIVMRLVAGNFLLESSGDNSPTLVEECSGSLHYSVADESIGDTVGGPWHAQADSTPYPLLLVERQIRHTTPALVFHRHHPKPIGVRFQRRNTQTSNLEGQENGRKGIALPAECLNPCQTATRGQSL